MNKQVFDTKKQAKLKRSTRRAVFVVALFLLGVFLFLFFGFSTVISVDMDTPGAFTMVFLASLLSVEFILMLLLPGMGIYFGVQRGRKKGYRESATYIGTQGITYYRDILKDVTPSDLSIVMDLKIEDRKDISATLLHMYNNGVIAFENNKIVVTGTTADNGERELIHMINSGGMNQQGIYSWKQNRFADAEKKGYIEKSGNKGCAGCGSGCLGIILAFICCIVIFVLFVDGNPVDFDEAPSESNAFFGDEINADTKTFALAAAILAIVDLIALLPSYSLFKVIGYSGTKIGIYRRTQKGDELTEKAAGLKRFINEFSVLSERAKEEVVLWDDFLVYAVILEENEKIIHDIVKYYNTCPSHTKKVNLGFLRIF